MILEIDTETWGERATSALERALSDVRDGMDAMPAVSLAHACLRAEMGELGDTDLAALLTIFDADPPCCTCTREQLTRGGFRGGCPTHAAAALS